MVFLSNPFHCVNAIHDLSFFYIFESLQKKTGLFQFFLGPFIVIDIHDHQAPIAIFGHVDGALFFHTQFFNLYRIF